LRCCFFGALEQSDLFDARGIGRAPGRNFRIVFESIVDKAPLIGIHRLELERTPCDAHPLGQLAHPLHDAIFAHRAVVFAIDDNFFGVLVSGLQ